MRSRFNQIDFKGTVVIGEGQKDEAPELYQGEKSAAARALLWIWPLTRWNALTRWPMAGTMPWRLFPPAPRVVV